PDAFLAQNAVHRLGDVRVFPAHDPRPRLDHRHPAAEAAVGLRQFQADIAATEHDQVRGYIVQVQSLDVRERPRFREAGNARYRRMRTDIDEDLVAGQPPRAAVVLLDLERLRRNEVSAAQDQFGTARREGREVGGDLSLDHVAFTLAHLRHVGRYRA